MLLGPTNLRKSSANANVVLKILENLKATKQFQMYLSIL